MATLAERERLSQMEWSLRARAQDVAETSRSQRRLFPTADEGAYPVLRTPMQNIAAATRIADSIQPSCSAADDIRHVKALLKTALQQNVAVTQSHNRVHSKSVRADTTASAHSPHVGRMENVTLPPRRDVSPHRRGNAPCHGDLSPHRRVTPPHH